MLAAIARFALFFADSGLTPGIWGVVGAVVALIGTIAGLIATTKISKRQNDVEREKANLSQVEAVNNALGKEIDRLRKDRQEDRDEYEGRIKKQDERIKSQDDAISTLTIDLRMARDDLDASLKREERYKEEISIQARAIERLEKKTDGI